MKMSQKQMNHIHNETVLAFFKANLDNKNVREALEFLNKTSEGNYLDYLEENIGDDSSFSLKELKQIREGKLKLVW